MVVEGMQSYEEEPRNQTRTVGLPLEGLFLGVKICNVQVQMHTLYFVTIMGTFVY